MYAKIFSQIFDSTLADNWQHRHVFEDLLKLSDQRGYVDMTPESIIARTRLPADMVMEALKALMLPDPRSRSKEEGGRRIVLIDSDRPWGWRIVNYLHYRGIKNEFDRTGYMRNYMRDKRSLDSVKPQSNNVKLSPSASASVQEEKESEEKPKSKPMIQHPTPESLARYGRIKDALHAAMRRKPNQTWDYAELSFLHEINQREGVEDELKELLAFQKKEGRYFPNSITALLSGWSSTLDRSRQPEDTNGKHQQNSPSRINGNTGTLNKPSAEKAARYTAIARRGIDSQV